MSQNNRSDLKSEQKITWLLGDRVQCERIRQQKPMVPFSKETMLFLAAVSDSLRKNPQVRREMSDVMAYAFWCRRTHLEQLKQKYLRADEWRMGKKVSLHFASSNIPVMFAFSFTAGLLAGNSCILRMPGKETRQEAVIIRTIHDLIEDGFPEFRGRILLCRYSHNAIINDALSSLCDVRVLWGSDDSVLQIRKSPLRPGAIDLPFAARYSAAVLDAKAVMQTQEPDILVKNFYNDTYLNDQNACSSPRIIYWMGTDEEISQAQVRFWGAVHEFLIQKQYQIPAVTAVQKLDAALVIAADHSGTKVIGAFSKQSLCPETDVCAADDDFGRRKDNLILRIQVEKLSPDIWEYMVPGGFFVECGGQDLKKLSPVLTGKCQTLSVYHVDEREVRAFLLSERLDGVDRIVPVGQALDFSLTWDGYDLIQMMSRKIGGIE